MTEQAPCCVPLEQPKKLRRIDILQSMTADALASFLSEITSCCGAVGYYSNPDIECCQLARCPFAEDLTDINECSAERIKRWLEEEVKEEKK